MIDKVVKFAQKKINNYGDVNFTRLTPVKYRKSVVNNGNIRLNLVLPKIDKKFVYGGISTAFHFFDELATTLNAEKRVITIDAPLGSNIKREYPNYTLKNAAEDYTTSSDVLVAADEKWRLSNTLPVRKTDIFVTTSWDTHFIISDVTSFQQINFGNKSDIIYLIQDFEPGFANWSSDYTLAESNYITGNTVAVFNSNNLKKFMDKHEYKFDKELYFDPVLNSSMADILKKSSLNQKRKNNILLYGRPSTSRNEFEIAVKAFKILVEQYDISKDWNFISIGEKHKDISLGNHFTLKSLGKLSLEEYSNLLLQSKLGVSLMCSPHPSYPPLEMATFGVKTITNSFECKDLSSFSPNIISVNNLNFYNLARVLNDAIKNYKNPTFDLDTKYVNDDKQFDVVFNELKQFYVHGLDN